MGIGPIGDIGIFDMVGNGKPDAGIFDKTVIDSGIEDWLVILINNKLTGVFIGKVMGIKKGLVKDGKIP